MFLRIFCRLESDLAYEVASLAASFDIPLRVTTWDFGFIFADPRWAQHSEWFGTPVPDEFVNVVCGDQDVLERLYTAGVENIALGTCSDDRYRVIESVEEFRRYLTEARARE